MVYLMVMNKRKWSSITCFFTMASLNSLPKRLLTTSYTLQVFSGRTISFVHTHNWSDWNSHRPFADSIIVSISMKVLHNQN
jgi:hypothetical protein